MVIDDAISKNETIKNSMRLSKPAGTGMSIIDTQKAITNFLAGKYDSQRVFVLVKEPETIIRLVDAGISIPKINLGIIFNEDGRKPVTKFVALNDKEKNDLQILNNKGIPITIQYVPNDPEETYKI